MSSIFHAIRTRIKAVSHTSPPLWQRRTLFPIVILLIASAGVIVLLQYTANLAQPSALSHTPPLPPHHAKPAPLPPPSYSFGGRRLLPAHRLVALYGAPGEPVLGALGEQDPAAAVVRVRQLADQYQPLSKEPVVPAMEIIATIASASPTENGDYSREIEPAKIMPWIHAAEQSGQYVLLDLQPGRSDFLSQAQLYAGLLAHPNVGLALDPEWRLAPDQVPLEQIGSVGIDEVNRTSAWLSDFTNARHLPQKLFVLHQFRLDMLPDRVRLDTSHSNLAYVIQMDGSGSQNQKQETWNAITANAPPRVSFGWKNFYDEDAPMSDPAGTMAHTPMPWYISYQ